MQDEQAQAPELPTIESVVENVMSQRETPEEPQAEAPEETEEAESEVVEESEAEAPEEVVAEAPEPEDEPEDDRFNKAFSELSRREAELREREAALKKLEAQASIFDELKALAQENPAEALERLGTNFEYAVKKQLEDPEDETTKQIRLLQEKLDALEAEKKREQETFQRQQAEQQVQEHINEVRRQAEAAGDQFELVSANWEQAKEYYREIQSQYAKQTLDKYGEALMHPPEEVLEMIEKEYQKQAEIFLNTRKVKSKFQKPPAPTQQEKPVKSTKTLTNKQTTKVPSAPPNKIVSEDDRLEAALMAFRQNKTA